MIDLSFGPFRAPSTEVFEEDIIMKNLKMIKRGVGCWVDLLKGAPLRYTSGIVRSVGPGQITKSLPYDYSQLRSISIDPIGLPRKRAIKVKDAIAGNLRVQSRHKLHTTRLPEVYSSLPGGRLVTSIALADIDRWIYTRRASRSIHPLIRVCRREYKIRGKPSLRCKDCYMVRRKGILRVLCRENKRHKQRKRHPISKYRKDYRKIALKNMGAREKRKTFVRIL